MNWKLWKTVHLSASKQYWNYFIKFSTKYFFVLHQIAFKSNWLLPQIISLSKNIVLGSIYFFGFLHKCSTIFHNNKGFVVSIIRKPLSVHPYNGALMILTKHRYKCGYRRVKYILLRSKKINVQQKKNVKMCFPRKII